MSDYTLPREERLRSLTAIRRLFSEGRGVFVYPFRVVTLVEECGGECEGELEVMFSVPKKFHKRANKRNLLKRRTREAYRLNRGDLKPTVEQSGKRLHCALVLSTKDIPSYKTIEYAVKRILEQVRESL